MKTQRYSADTRGTGEASWLHSKFSFSFANYYNPARMGFGTLRVLNDDIIAPSNGFGMHEHDNMEIVTIVTEGMLEHTDSEGNGGILRAGDVQVMSAGFGIKHSEFNSSDEEPLALFQMWINTKEQNIKPHYDQKTFSFPENVLVVVASGSADTDALYIHQDTRVLVGNFNAGTKHTHSVTASRGVFLFVIEGSFTVAGETLSRRDALEITDTHSVTLEAVTHGKVMLIEVPL